MSANRSDPYRRTPLRLPPTVEQWPQNAFDLYQERLAILTSEGVSEPEARLSAEAEVRASWGAAQRLVDGNPSRGVSHPERQTIHPASSLPDCKYIRRIPIAQIAEAMGLRLASSGNIHCWHPENHQHGDADASVGIRRENNTVKCFGAGCNLGPLSPIDLVMDATGYNILHAAEWVAQRFPVPRIPKGRHSTPPLPAVRGATTAKPLELLVNSGVWATLRPATKQLIPVLLESAEFSPLSAEGVLRMSYRAMIRYAGLSSHSAIAGALRELEGIGWLEREKGEPSGDPIKQVTSLKLTPLSDAFIEHANELHRKHRAAIEQERELRKQAQRERRRKLGQL